MKQMFIPNSLQVKMIEKDKSKHMRRLDEILTQDRKAKIVEKDVNSTLKLSNTRQNNLKLSHKGKANELEQENELLLGKLVEISRKKSPNFQIRSESANGKSLHAPYKKREMMRISSENEAFAKRLISQQSTFNRKKLDTDFRKHKEMVGNLKRIHSSPGKNLGKKILPPIKSELTSPKAVSLKQSEVRSSLVKENKETQKEQPQQESTIVPSTIANDNKDVVTPVVPEKKEEAKPKENETVQANAVKQENTTSVLEASNLQKSQEVPENPAQENKSQRVENAEVKVENANNETVKKEEK